MQPRPADLLAWLTLLGSLSLTVVLWAAGLSLRGGL
jgi:hypothetical protein